MGKTKEEEKDPVRTEVALIFHEAKVNGERRNAYMNMTWTGPIDNTDLQENISLGKVENCLLYTSPSPRD